MFVAPKTLDDAVKLIEKLFHEIEGLKAENALLKEEVVELERRLAKYEGAKPPDPATPSGMIPPYEKPRGKRKKKKPGRKKGHRGARRKTPRNIDRKEHHVLEKCPHCGSTDIKHQESRVRYIEDLPRIKPEVTEHTIERCYCRNCCRMVEPMVDEALPRGTFGIRLLLMTAFMHYAMGVPVRKVVKWLGSICQMEVTAGGLTQAWEKIARRLEPLYGAIWEEIRQSAVLNVDETGWRVMGKTFWMWCFAASDAVMYVIDRSRGSPVLLKVLGEAFDGILVCDFWGAYNRIEAWAKQRCIVHLFRELEKVSEKNSSLEWKAFYKKLCRLLRDALRLGSAREKYDAATYDRRWLRLYDRLEEMYRVEYVDADCIRLADRLYRHRVELFPFLEYNDVPADNNYAEREIRHGVICRKTYYGNRSGRGAEVQGILMTIFRTLEKRGVNSVDFLVDYVKQSMHNQEMEEKRFDELLPRAA